MGGRTRIPPQQKPFYWTRDHNTPLDVTVLANARKPEKRKKNTRKIPILTAGAVFAGLATLQTHSAAEQPAQHRKPFTIAVLPDIQSYCDCRHKLSAKWGNGDLRRYFFEQSEWVRDNQKRLNIKFLVHEGDIVQADAPEEWAVAKEAMSVLDGKVPYCMCLGNHDMGYEKTDTNKYGFNIAVNRTTHFNTYFPRAKFAERPEFGGTFDPDRHDNSWYHFEAAGLKFLMVALEYHPRDEVLDWANRIVAEHPGHRAIVLTHAYLKGNKTRTTNKLKLKGNNGEQMWQKFVRKHKNMFMVLCGHFSGEAVLTSTGDHGNPVHQILSDYQGMNNGGESWLRYMVFQSEANKIEIYTYNPALDKFKDGPSSRFDLDYSMASAPGITRAGAANDGNKEVKQDGAHQPATAPDSQEGWNRDKPTVAWIFPFIDKNSDGKIDSDEYQAIQEYKKKHRDWQNQARKELGLTAPKDP